MIIFFFFFFVVKKHISIIYTFQKQKWQMKRFQLNNKNKNLFFFYLYYAKLNQSFNFLTAILKPLAMKMKKDRLKKSKKKTKQIILVIFVRKNL